ncbi:hypothetical protein CLOM_g20699 [Closterium sp. NIES-68]|nr:hypothetical protein CLOM_g20699 [Closterium sp. NIES-68]
MSIYALGQLRAQINVWISFRNGKVPPRSDLALALRRLPRLSRNEAKELEIKCKGKMSSKISAALEPPSKKSTKKTPSQAQNKKSSPPNGSHNTKSKSKAKVKQEPGDFPRDKENEENKSTIRASFPSCSATPRDILLPEGHLRLISSIPESHKDRFLEFQQRIIRDIVLDFKLAAGLLLRTPRLKFNNRSLISLWKRWAAKGGKPGLEGENREPDNEADKRRVSQRNKVLGKRQAASARSNSVSKDAVNGNVTLEGVQELPAAATGVAALKSSWMERKTKIACNRRKRNIEAFLGDIIRQRESMVKVAEAKEETRRLTCQRVMEFHEQRKREYEEQQLMLQRQKVELLRNNDMEGYLKLVKNMKSERVQNLLKETEAHLQRIAGRIASVRQQKGHVQGQEDEEAEPDAGELSTASNHLDAEKAYTNFLHKKSEIVQQPAILSGGQLREYQRDGLQWLASLHANGLNGILADEMGLGKTVQVIALLCYLVEVKKIPGPFLIVAPASVLPNWVAEFGRWAPSLRVSRYSGMPDKRAAIFSREINPWMRCPPSTGSDGGEAQRKWLEERGVPNVVVTTYEMLMGKLDRPRLIRLSWEYVILDEGHRIKSAECKLNAHLKSYKSRHRILLSGTPIQNNLEELWSLLNFLLPSVFNCASDFASWFSQPLAHVLPKKAGTGAPGSSVSAEQEDVLGEEERLLLINRLHQVLRPFVLRRLKHKVASELPKRLERRIPCAASAYQQWLIQQVLQHQVPTAGSASTQANSVYNSILPVTKKRSAPSIMNAVMEQRGICNHPFLSSLHDKEMEENLPSGPLPPLISTCGKLETLHRILHKLHAAKHKVLLFCTMTRLLDIVEEYIEGQQKAHVELQEKNEWATKLLLEQEKQQQQQQQRQQKEKQQKLAKTNKQKGKAEEAKVSSRQQRLTRRQQQTEEEQLIDQTTETPVPPSSTSPSTRSPWSYFRLDGSTGGSEREELVREFNDPESDVFIFLLSVRAGGVGINLQAADTVIMYDTDWNPQIDLQAQARAHRIGQKNDVLVIRLETLGTVEQRVRTAAERKLGLANQSITAGFFDNQTSAAERQIYLETLLRTEDQGVDELEAALPAPDDDYCSLAISDTHLNNLLARSEEEKAIFAAADRERELQEEETWQCNTSAQDSSQDSCTPNTASLTRRLLGPAALQKLVQRMCQSSSEGKENQPADVDEELGRGKRRRTARFGACYDENILLRGEE